MTRKGGWCGWKHSVEIELYRAIRAGGFSITGTLPPLLMKRYTRRDRFDEAQTGLRTKTAYYDNNGDADNTTTNKFNHYSNNKANANTDRHIDEARSGLRRSSPTWAPPCGSLS